MTKGDAAGALVLMLAFALFGAWFLSALYAAPDSKLRKCVDVLTVVSIAVMSLGIIGFAIYCIYILIA